MLEHGKKKDSVISSSLVSNGQVEENKVPRLERRSAIFSHVLPKTLELDNEPAKPAPIDEANEEDPRERKDSLTRATRSKSDPPQPISKPGSFKKGNRSRSHEGFKHLAEWIQSRSNSTEDSPQSIVMSGRIVTEV
jgi:hypothetical protein